MNNNQALKPSFLSQYREVIKTPVEEDEVEAYEEALAHLDNLKGWKIIKEHINSLTAGLENSVVAGMEKGQSFAEIGQSTAVTQIAKEVLKQIIDLVDDAKEATDKRASRK